MSGGFNFDAESDNCTINGVVGESVHSIVVGSGEGNSWCAGFVFVIEDDEDVEFNVRVVG